MDTLKEELLRALECPVCFECMLPPIMICWNGHSICSTCKASLKNCPTCGKDLLDVRNRTAEDVSRIVEHPCKFQKSGCERKFRVGPKEEHERVCRFGPHKCPLYIVDECQWEGTAEDIKQHVENAHQDTYIITIKTQEKQLAEYQNYVADVIDGKFWYQIVSSTDKTFFCLDEMVGDILYMCIMYIGSREENNYKYTINIKTSDGVENVSSCLRCPHYMDFIDGEFPNEKCATFRKDFTMLCVNSEGVLKIEYQISEI